MPYEHVPSLTQPGMQQAKREGSSLEHPSGDEQNRGFEIQKWRKCLAIRGVWCFLNLSRRGTAQTDT
jgi:hypothetical protein